MEEPSPVIEEWTTEHPRWNELVQAIAEQNQTNWAFASFFEPFPRHFIVAQMMTQQESKVVGFLMFVVWEIGPHDRSLPPIQLKGVTLTEAKVIAFGVHQAYRRQGIGRALQQHTIGRAKELGCYQLRSVSGNDHPENYQLKLSMGFAVEPMERDTPSVAFVMPLR